MRKRVGAAVCMSLVVGCASPKIVYDPVLPFEPGDASVSSFTVMGGALPAQAVGIDTPIDYSSMSANNPAMYNPAISPGAAAAGSIIAVLIIAAVDAGIDSARNQQINSFLTAHGFDAKAVFEQALQAELQRLGYSASFGNGARTERDFVAENVARQAGTDASLDVVIQHYGLNQTIGGWTPTIVADVMVRRVSDGEILLRDRVQLSSPARGAAGSYYPGGGGLAVSFEPEFYFVSVDEMVNERPEQGVRAFESSLQRVAAGVARLVRTSGAAPDTAVSANVQTPPAGAAPAAQPAEAAPSTATP